MKFSNIIESNFNMENKEMNNLFDQMYLTLIKDYKMHISPGIGGWDIWCEKDGRESETRIVRVHNAVLENAIVSMMGLMDS